MTKPLPIPREVRDALQQCDTAYVITVKGELVESFLFGQGCPCCQADAITDAILQTMQVEAESEDMPQIFTNLLEIVNHEEGRQN